MLGVIIKLIYIKINLTQHIWNHLSGLLNQPLHVEKQTRVEFNN